MTNTEVTDNDAAVAEQGAQVAPEKTAARKGASPKKRAPKGHKSAKGGKSKPAAPNNAPRMAKGKAGVAKNTSARRAASKSAKIIEMIGRAKGATLAEIMKATGWQAHSIRGFMSTAGKKHKLQIESARNEAGERVYTTAK